jgi:hypothetical protein
MGCQARPDVTGKAGTPFTINEAGVKIGNKTYPWAGPRRASEVTGNEE